MLDKKYWSVLFNVQPVPIILLKADYPVYTIVFANEAYKKLTNTHHKDIVGNSFADLLLNYYSNIDETLDSLSRLLKDQAEQKQSAVKFEFQLPETKSTGLKYLNIFNTPIQGDDGEVEYIIRTINDITDVIVAQKKEKAIYEDLVKHEKLLSESQRIAHIGNWEVNMVDNSIVWSDVLKGIYEVPLDYQPTFESSLSLYKDNRTRDILINAVNEAIEKKVYLTSNWR